MARRLAYGAILAGLVGWLAIANLYERYLYCKLFALNWDEQESVVLKPGNVIYEQSLQLASTLKESPAGVRMAIGKIGKHINHHRCDGHWFYWIIRHSPLPEVNDWLFVGCADFKRSLRFRKECASLLLDRTQNPTCYFFLYDIASSSRTNLWSDAVGVRQARLDLVDFYPWPEALSFYMPHDVNVPVGASRDEFITAVRKQCTFTNSISLF